MALAGSIFRGGTAIRGWDSEGLPRTFSDI